MRTVDLFCGGGGLSLGFQNVGFDIVAAFDKWQSALEVYKLNFKHDVFDDDLSSPSVVSKIQSMKPTVIIGGPPCQDFSSAGKRDESCGRADLTISFSNIIANIKPKWFVMENVDRAAKSNTFLSAIKTFKENNYGITIRVLDASRCGAPQIRKRVFVIGKMFEKDDFLGNILDNRQSDTQMTLREYFGDSLGVEYYYRHPRSYARRGIFSIDEPSPTIRGVNRPIPKGYSKHSGDPCDIFDGLRALSVEERALIQTFPVNFKFIGTKTDIEQVVGNAVPVKLAEFVASAITEYENRNKIESFSGLIKNKNTIYSGIAV